MKNVTLDRLLEIFNDDTVDAVVGVKVSNIKRLVKERDTTKEDLKKCIAFKDSKDIVISKLLEKISTLEQEKNVLIKANNIKSEYAGFKTIKIYG